MQLLGHRVAGGGAELGVLGQYLDGELHLVDNSLSVGLIAGPKLKIGQVITKAVTIFVVNRLHISQRAAEVFRHYVTVLQNFSAASKVQSHVSGRVHVAFGIDRAPRSTSPPAFFAAEFLTFVVAGMFAVQRLHETPFFRFAAQLALKSRGWFLVHTEQLLDSPVAVKGVI